MKIITAAFTTFCLLSSMSFAADNTGPWTETQVKTLCHFRAADEKQKAKHYDACMKRHANLEGKPKRPGDANELDKADARLDKLAKEKPQKTAPAQ